MPRNKKGRPLLEAPLSWGVRGVPATRNKYFNILLLNIKMPTFNEEALKKWREKNTPKKRGRPFGTKRGRKDRKEY